MSKYRSLLDECKGSNCPYKLTGEIFWVVPEVIADYFIQIKRIILNTRNEL